MSAWKAVNSISLSNSISTVTVSPGSIEKSSMWKRWVAEAHRVATAAIASIKNLFIVMI